MSEGLPESPGLRQSAVGVSLLPDGDHPLAVFVLLFVHVDVRPRDVLDGRDVAAAAAHDAGHDRGGHRELLGPGGTHTRGFAA